MPVGHGYRQIEGELFQIIKRIPARLRADKESLLMACLMVFWSCSKFRRWPVQLKRLMHLAAHDPASGRSTYGSCDQVVCSPR